MSDIGQRPAGVIVSLLGGNMAAYIIGQVIVHDMEKFEPYVQDTTAVIEKYGGEVLDVVQAKETLEGSWPTGALTALVRFPSEEQARQFWESPENVGMKDLRQATHGTHSTSPCYASRARDPITGKRNMDVTWVRT